MDTSTLKSCRWGELRLQKQIEEYQAQILTYRCRTWKTSSIRSNSTICISILHNCRMIKSHYLYYYYLHEANRNKQAQQRLRNEVHSIEWLWRLTDTINLPTSPASNCFFEVISYTCKENCTSWCTCTAVKRYRNIHTMRRK